MKNQFNNLHTSVLASESIALLNIKPDGVYVDATAGFGGHSQLILNQLSNQGKLICLDQDEVAINALKSKFANANNVTIIKANFSHYARVLSELNIKQVDGVIADLGVSSPMLDNASRGFSYHTEAKLDMRMDTNQELDAFQVVNYYSFKQLQDIFSEYGECHYAKTIANAIVNARQTKLIETTLELVEIIKSCLPNKELNKHKHPARVIFQAIRIEVNNELNVLKYFLIQAINSLKPNGVLSVISYHSLEDRIVKQTFNSFITSALPIEIPIKEQINYQLTNKKPILPSQNEINNNHRSRSAKLRGIRKV